MLDRWQSFNRTLDQRPFWRDLLILLLFSGLTVLISQTVLRNLNSGIIGFDNDANINPWADWWTLRVLTTPNTSLWWTDLMFYPAGASLTYHSFSHLNTAVSLLFQQVMPPLVAYNLSVLINYPLIGLSMFQLARHLTKSNSAALIAGIAFAFNSHALYQSSHPVLLSIWCFPWATLALLKAVETDRLRPAVWAAVFVFLGTATSTLLFFMMIVWFGFLFIYWWIAPEWKRPSWQIITLFAALSGLFCLPLLWPLLQDALINRNTSFIINEGKAVINDLVAPLVPHWVLYLRRGLYWGFVGIYLLLFARRQGVMTRLWFVTLIGFYLISIGPQPEILYRELPVTLPWSLPFVPILRNPYRLNILASLGLSMLLAYGWLQVRSMLNNGRLQRLATCLVPLLLLADYAGQGMPMIDASHSTFYTEFLDEVPDEAVLTLFPPHRQYAKFYLYYQTLHGHPMTNGVISRPTDATFAFVDSNALLRLRTVEWWAESPPIPDDMAGALDQLADAGVTYFVINKQFLRPKELDRWIAAMPLTPIFEDDLAIAYQLVE